MSGKDVDVKREVVEKMTDDLQRSSNGKLSREQAQTLARESAERVNRGRKK